MQSFAQSVVSIASNHSKYTFPAYLKVLAAASVIKYTIHLCPHKAVFEGKNGETVDHLNPAYDVPSVSDVWNCDDFKAVLKKTQTGACGYHDFLLGAAEAGVNYYEVDFLAKKVSYYGKDRSNNCIENIPPQFLE